MVDPRVNEYQIRHNSRLNGFLGAGPGQDGFVLRSHRLTAVKFFDRIDRFDRELEIYQILLKRDIHNIAGHQIPKLIEFDEALRAIEMTVVNPSFLLDFAGAKRPWEVPDFEQHVLDEHMLHVQELFDDRWTDAQHVAEAFRQATGFVLMDIHPGNVAFGD